MTAWFYALASVIIVSVISLIGILTLLLGPSLKKVLFVLVSFAVGALFGGAFFHLIPESIEHSGAQLSSLYIMTGIVAFFVLEKFIHWRHCHVGSESCTHHIVTMNLIGDTIHNFIDGLLIGASYLVDINLGIATTLAIVLHEIPQEFGDFAVFIHGGCSIRRALAYNFLSALLSIVGALTALIVGQEVHSFSEVLIPIAAGGFIYIAGSDLIPELKHNVRLRDSGLQLAAIILGLAIMLFLSRPGHL